MITVLLIVIVTGWIMTGLVWLLALAYAATTAARFVATSISSTNKSHDVAGKAPVKVTNAMQTCQRSLCWWLVFHGVLS